MCALLYSDLKSTILTIRDGSTVYAKLRLQLSHGGNNVIFMCDCCTAITHTCNVGDPNDPMCGRIKIIFPFGCAFLLSLFDNIAFF